MSEKLEISFPDSPYCEHCGDMSPGTCQIKIDGVWWCIYCAADVDGGSDLDIEALEKQQDIEERKQLQARIDEIDAKKS